MHPIHNFWVVTHVTTHEQKSQSIAHIERRFIMDHNESYCNMLIYIYIYIAEWLRTANCKWTKASRSRTWASSPSCSIKAWLNGSQWTGWRACTTGSWGDYELKNANILWSSYVLWFQAIVPIWCHPRIIKHDQTSTLVPFALTHAVSQVLPANAALLLYLNCCHIPWLESCGRAGSFHSLSTAGFIFCGPMVATQHFAQAPKDDWTRWPSSKGKTLGLTTRGTESFAKYLGSEFHPCRFNGKGKMKTERTKMKNIYTVYICTANVSNTVCWNVKSKTLKLYI